ncbi:MAG: T9SS type A sorting domain-containing protein [Bacteroidota bacterium]|nr:T9SS type A sorting domain-containing protein [Bacteroidota bacterium]
MIFENWMENSWKMTFRSTNNYDSNGNLISDYDEQWKNNIWKKITTNTHTLNPDGTIKETLTKSWDEDTNEWEESSKTVYTYNASKKILTETDQIFMDKWIDFTKETYNYDSNGKLTSLVIQSLDILSGMVLKNSSRTLFSYNEDGTEKQIVDQIWNTMNQWEDQSRTTNTYNTSKQLVSDLSEKWEINTWVNFSRSTNIYNANGTLKETIEEEWKEGNWIKNGKAIYSFNANGDIVSLVSQKWNITLNDWENEMRIRLEYTTGIQPAELADNNAKVYPNPFNDQLTIEHETLSDSRIEVFNSTGQLVSSFKPNKSVTTLNMGAHKKGVYFMKIKSPKNDQTIKLLKAK